MPSEAKIFKGFLIVALISGVIFLVMGSVELYKSRSLPSVARMDGSKRGYAGIIIGFIIALWSAIGLMK